MAPTLTASHRASVFFAAASVVALALVGASPFAVAALGLATFGLLHITLELRYVIGRFSDILRGSFGWWMLGLTSATMLARGLTGVVPGTARLEIVLAFAIVAAGCVRAFGTRTAPLAAALAVVVALLAVSLAWPRGYFFVLTHAHNLIPVAFLWDWSRRLRPAQRRVFMAVQLTWAVVVPAALLLGVADAARGHAPTWLAPLVGDGQAQIAAASPPGFAGELGWRYLVVFAFMQTMHYVTWIAFLPAASPDVTRSFEARVPALRGWRLWALGLGASAVLFVVFLASYPLGRAIYSLIATYHVYIELPLLVVLFAGVLRPGVAARARKVTAPGVTR